MSVRLDSIIPWGRSGQEYELMFGLTEADRRGKILGCGDGPASFNAEMTQAGLSVVSCDPLYELSADQIQERFDASVEPLMAQVRANLHNYVWSYHHGPDELLSCRQAVVRNFVSDFPAGLVQGRYVLGRLPRLPFGDGQFDLAVCSHLLFLYSDILSFDFHLSSIRELCRVAKEARIFPLTTLTCDLSPHVAPIQTRLRRLGFQVELVKVSYQLQRNGNQMMRVWR